MSKAKLNLAPRNVSTTRLVLFFSFIFSIVFSSTGAAGSFGSRFQSFFVWIPTTLLAFVCLILTHSLFKHRIKLNFWVLSFIEGVFGSLIFAPLAYFLDVYLGTDPGPYLSGMGIFEEFGHVWLPVTVCWIIVKSPRYFGFVLPIRIDPDFVFNQHLLNKSDSEIEIIGTFLEMIPKELGKDIIYLKAEKQYLMVTTPLGSKLVHHGLNQAIRSFSDGYGVKIHRSIWVVKKHIHRIDKRKRVVIMSNCSELPISRRLLSSISN